MFISVFWMSVRLTVSVFYRNGTALLRFNRTNDIRLLVRTKVAPRSVHTKALNPIVNHNSSPSSGWQNRWNLARRAFVDNLLSRVTNSLSADLRRRTARHLMYGNSRPFFALVGISLASGNGLITNENQLEGVCWEIRVSALFISSMNCLKYILVSCYVFLICIGSSWSDAKELNSCWTLEFKFIFGLEAVWIRVSYC